MNELSAMILLASDRMRSTVRQVASQVEINDPVARAILDFYNDPKNSGVKETLALEMQAHLSKLGVPDIGSLMTQIMAASNMPEDRVKPMLEHLNNFLMQKSVTKILTDAKGDASAIVTGIKSLESVAAQEVPYENMGDIDIDRVMEEELGTDGAIPSCFEFIKRSSPWGGYLRGQVVQFMAAPGVGKTLAMINECWTAMYQQQACVHYFALGDMMKLDFITRFTSVATGVAYNEVALNPKKYYSNEIRNVLKNLNITVVPAGVMDILTLHEFVEDQARRVKTPDIGVIDYDANLAMQGGEDSTYHSQGNAYNILSRIARPEHGKYRLVMVASQPKIMFWGDEKLPMEASADSSRKQAIVDLMVTFGRCNNYNIKAGIGQVAKARRGKVGECSPFYVTSCGHFKEIPEDQYLTMKQSSSR